MSWNKAWLSEAQRTSLMALRISESKDGKGLDLLGEKNVSQREIETQAGINNLVTSNYEASFVIEMKQGRIRPIPFGPSGQRIVGDMPLPRNYAKILAPRMENYQDAYYSVGYFSTETNMLVALLMIQPQQGGARIFSLIDLGMTLFGYCYTK